MDQRPAIDLVDETFVVAPRAELERVLCDESAWRRRGYELDCYDDRGELGRRWRVSGALEGTCEVWLEPVHDGVVVHLYVRADPVGGSRSWSRLERRWVRPLKAWVLEVKAEHDRRRPAGVPGPGRQVDSAGVPGPGRQDGPAGVPGPGRQVDSAGVPGSAEGRRGPTMRAHTDEEG